MVLVEKIEECSSNNIFFRPEQNVADGTSKVEAATQCMNEGELSFLSLCLRLRILIKEILECKSLERKYELIIGLNEEIRTINFVNLKCVVSVYNLYDRLLESLKNLYTVLYNSNSRLRIAAIELRNTLISSGLLQDINFRIGK